ncbi:unnamed protein product [Echinostoma caproni]|uniref:Peptidase_M13_N domain-containing protein n=1 Tax=Echinostoma caproni TaxID=27848 RepID=A0A183AYB4_9TREM|nr:unnamed protein product [Echinostoma caproni]
MRSTPSGTPPDGPSGPGSKEPIVQVDVADLWFTNACSLGGKWGELMARTHISTIIGIPETWLTEGQAVTAPHNHIRYRQDRIDGSLGGGVLLMSKGTTRESVGTFEMANGNIASTDNDRAETLMDYFKSVYRSSQGDGARNPLSKGTTRESVGTFEMANGNIASTDKDRAEALMDYFKSVYRSSQGDGARNPLVDTIGSELQMLIVNEEEVRTELRSLYKYKVADPDEIHPAYVQPQAEIILGPVTDLFKASLTFGVVPEDWRRATVVAMYKTGPR